MKSILQPPQSVLVGLAEATAVYAIYNSSLPAHADIRSSSPNDSTIESARKAAAWKSGAVLGFIFLLTRDLNSFMVGGLALAGVDYMVKHSNGINPLSGKLSSAAPAGSAINQASSNATAYSMPSYDDAAYQG